MTDNDIESAIREYIQHDCDFRDLCQQADEEHKDADEALDQVMDRAVDYVSCDIPALVQSWMENHGGQVVDLVVEELSNQEPDIDYAISKMENAILDLKREVTSAMDHKEGEDLINFVNDRKAQIEEIKAKIATLEGEDE